MANLDGHLLQGFAIDGRVVRQLEVSGFVKTENVVAGTQDLDQKPYIAITLYNDERRQIQRLDIGPFVGTAGWHEERRTFQIPKEARERRLFELDLLERPGPRVSTRLRLRR